jgi:LysM repeat protein
VFPRQRFIAGCVVATVLSLAGCSVRGDDPPEPIPNDDVFVIVTPTPGTPRPATEAAPLPARYVVQPGDNLTEIAARLGVTVQALQEANGIENPDAIYAGQVLAVPTPKP